VKPAHRFVITGLDAAGQPTPVMAKITCEGRGSSFVVHAAIEAVHGFARNQREEGFVVTVEWLYEVPDECLDFWAQYYLVKHQTPTTTTKEQ